MSQERAAMSSSWSGHPAMSALVMEWMLGVERSGGAERSQDQRSLSSRGATRDTAPPTTQHLRDLRDSRTSPRSKQRQAQHRSMSQERAAMSSSWSGHPAMSALNYQSQLEAVP